MDKNWNSFRHCHNENIQVYCAYGRDPFEAVQSVMKGLKKIKKETGDAPRIANIAVHYEEDYSLDEYCYYALAFIYGGI